MTEDSIALPGRSDQPIEPRLEHVSRIGNAALLGRAIRRRCPNCGVGKVYAGFTQLETCDNCRYRFSREYGYFLGALIVAYAVIGATALTAMLILASIGAPTLVALGIPLATSLLVLPFFIPLSHTLWMAIDVRFDPPKPEDFEPLGPNRP